MNSRRARLLGPILFVAVVVLAAVGAFVLGKTQAQGPTEQIAPPARGLPLTPDYHSLYVDPANSRHLLLGTHVGIYESRDGGVTWVAGPLGGRDAMNIVRAPDGTFWVAGHNVLERSDDGGRTWTDVHPDGLPHLDLHGFAVDPRGHLYAAASGSGLYRSADDGSSFEQVSDEVGAGAYGLVAKDDGILLAAEPGRGLLRSEDAGKSWRVALAAPMLRLGASPSVAGLVLATGERIWRSEDEGKTWTHGFDPGSALEPVAWGTGAPGVVYTITPETRTLYRSSDGGKTWEPVS